MPPLIEISIFVDISRRIRRTAVTQCDEYLQICRKEPSEGLSHPSSMVQLQCRYSLTNSRVHHMSTSTDNGQHTMTMPSQQTPIKARGWNRIHSQVPCSPRRLFNFKCSPSSAPWEHADELYIRSSLRCPVVDSSSGCNREAYQSGYPQYLESPRLSHPYRPMLQIRAHVLGDLSRFASKPILQECRIGFEALSFHSKAVQPLVTSRQWLVMRIADVARGREGR